MTTRRKLRGINPQRLKVRAELDSKSYPKGIKVTDEEFAAIRILRNEFHGEWNYSVTPSINKMIM